MKVTHVSTGDFGGGAARAAHRIHGALVGAGIDSRMRVLQSATGDERVTTAPVPHVGARLAAEVFRRLVAFRERRWSTDNPVYHSFGRSGAGITGDLNASDTDLLNLHWISGILSIADIGRLRKPIVWTLHDMWPICGGEHYAPDESAARFRLGYRRDNRPAEETGPDLNLLAWKAKRRAWARQNFIVVCPSKWLARCVSESALLSSSRTVVIPNCLDTDSVWRPTDRGVARSVLGLPGEPKLIIFGADGGCVDPRKGGDLLRQAISRLASRTSQRCELAIFGQKEASGGESWPCTVHWLGQIHDDRLLALAYSAADVMVVPSRQDNLPNTAVEAQACGIPVAGFNIGGIPDIVAHRRTGWLAAPFDPDDLADGILWLLDDESRHAAISSASREEAVRHFSESVVAKAYVDLYRQVIAGAALGKRVEG